MIIENIPVATTMTGPRNQMHVFCFSHTLFIYNLNTMYEYMLQHSDEQGDWRRISWVSPDCMTQYERKHVNSATIQYIIT